MPKAKAITFTNYSTEDFSHTWDSVEYTFPAGESTMLQDYLAFHFAKYLAMRELTKKDKNAGFGKNVLTNEMSKALGKKSIEAVDDTQLNNEIINYNDMKKAELVEIAEEKGIEVEGKKKADLVADLEEIE